MSLNESMEDELLSFAFLVDSVISVVQLFV